MGTSSALARKLSVSIFRVAPLRDDLFPFSQDALNSTFPCYFHFVCPALALLLESSGFSFEIPRLVFLSLIS